MPWNTGDVDKHIKGLSDSQKETWVKIANGSLSSCLAGGKEQGFCEGYAIRVANAKAKGVSESDKLWDEFFVKSLPDKSFAYIDEDKKRYFPYRDKEGNISIVNLQECLSKVLLNEHSAMAMPKLKAAAKEMKIGEYSRDYKGGEGYFTSALSITEIMESFKGQEKYNPNDEKREFVIPLLKEGWGNQRDSNYYSPKAVIESASYFKARKKQYLNHPKDESDDRDIRDWAASIQETWIDKLPDGKLISLGRTRAIKNSAGDWLWSTVKSAPEDIATSALGRGRAKKTTIEGREANFIESIEFIKSSDFVDYAGNTPIGMVYFVESAKFDDKGNVIEEIKTNEQEDKEMNFDELTVKMLKENKPEMVASIEESAVQESKKKISELETKISEKDKEVTTLKNKVDSYEVKEKISAKKELTEKLLKESDLPEEAKTDIFREQLMGCQEMKKDDKTVTVEEGIKSLITDRAKILGKKGVVNMGREENHEEIKETEAQEAVNKGIFGIEKKKEDKK